MNGFTVLKQLFDRKFLRHQIDASLLILLGIFAVGICGCQKNQQSADTKSTSPKPDQFLDPIQVAKKDSPVNGPDGKTILENLIQRYAEATTYQDKAVLYLNYLIQGQRIQEPQPWATAFQNSAPLNASPKLSAQLFNGEIRCDENIMSCYVYDIETANLDNQLLLIPFENQLPLNQLYRDSIAKHFIGGYSELPLDESDLVSSPKLIPAPISLLTNQVRNGWLQNPAQVQRMPDQVVENVNCFVVRCLHQGMTADIWIDKTTSTLRQMSLPLKLLAGEVIVSPEITDVVLMAKFHEAEFDKPINEKVFAFQPPSEATPVRKFVQLPEPFPSELIGKTAPEFELLTRKGEARSRLFFDGKVTALLWIAGQPSYNAITQLEEFAQKLDATKFHVASIYSDSALLTPGQNSINVRPELSKVLEKIKMPTYYDPQLQASTNLGVKAIPSVVVLDGESKIQFARALSDDNWLADVEAAVRRVADGDDVAGEMQADYVRYLDSYHQQLTTVSAGELLDRIDTSSSQISPASDSRPRVIRLRPEQEWVNYEFKQAGNVAVLNSNQPSELLSENTYSIFDGWRTVVEVNHEGKTLRRTELKLPVGEAANLIRVGNQANGKPLTAVFATLGDKVFLYDENWRPLLIYPTADKDHLGIRDCRLTDLDHDGISELAVAFEGDEGIHLVDPRTGQASQISKTISTSLVATGEDIVIAGAGKIGTLKTGLTNVEETELDFKRVGSSGEQHLCGIGVTEGGNWNAVGFDQQLRRIWTLSIGSQFFESQLEPIAVAQIGKGQSSEVLWAIADTEDVIHLVSGSGKWLGDFQSTSQIGGMGIDSKNGKTRLIVCNKSGVECWDLNLESSAIPVHAASTTSKQ